MPSGLPAILPPVDEEAESSSDKLVQEALESDTGVDDDQQAGKIEGMACTSATFESALTSAFNRTDEEFGKADNAALVGTTAVVALVGSRQLYVANCGAFLCFPPACLWQPLKGMYLDDLHDAQKPATKDLACVIPHIEAMAVCP